MAHRTLQELNLREDGVTVLGVDRLGMGYFGSPSGDFKMLPGDTVTLYGKSGGIHNLYIREKDHYSQKK